MEDYKAMHKELGCYECKFADRGALNKGPCCQNINGPLAGKDGRCERRR